jgi:hypothetical protein
MYINSSIFSIHFYGIDSDSVEDIRNSSVTTQLNSKDIDLSSREFINLQDSTLTKNSFSLLQGNKEIQVEGKDKKQLNAWLIEKVTSVFNPNK